MRLGDDAVEVEGRRFIVSEAVLKKALSNQNRLKRVEALVAKYSVPGATGRGLLRDLRDALDAD